ncbi:MAG: extracellular solute-binding protein [Gammaproteobacteria bacterium]|nr:extracellular solute-binding protein [Gammaproteobacteria bacterium]MDH5213228.1 extracellular solute-binding protein [Gammaproteobacteria bacterium]
MTVFTTRLLCIAALSAIVAACGGSADDAGNVEQRPQFVVVYTALEEPLLAPVYKAFTDESGIRVQQVTADNGRLLQMMQEKHSPPADLFLADGAAVLWRMAEIDVFRPTHAEDLQKAVPARLRDPEFLWSGLALKASVLVVNSSLGGNAGPKTYESLGDPQWKGRVCLSSSSFAENVGWVSLLIDRYGVRQSELNVRRLVANLALPVFDDSRSLIEAVQSARCDAGIVSLGVAYRQLSEGAVSGASIVAPAAVDGGTLVDVVGAGVARHAGNPETARRLLLWLVGNDGQRMLAERLDALPAATSAQAPARAGFPVRVEQSDISVFRLGALNQDALDLSERARYP